MSNESNPFGADLEGRIQGPNISHTLPKKTKLYQPTSPEIPQISPLSQARHLPLTIGQLAKIFRSLPQTYTPAGRVLAIPRTSSIAPTTTFYTDQQFDLSKIEIRKAFDISKKYGGPSIFFQEIPKNAVHVAGSSFFKGCPLLVDTNVPSVPAINLNHLDSIISSKISNFLDSSKKTVILPSYAHAEYSPYFLLAGHAPHLEVDEAAEDSLTLAIDESAHFFTKFSMRKFQDGKNYFSRNNMQSLEDKLKYLRENKHGSERERLIVTHAVDAEGRMANLPGIIALAKDYDFKIILDISQDFMSMGEKGGGVLEIQGIPKEDYSLFRYFIGAFDKSPCNQGGFIMVPEKEFEIARGKIPDLTLRTSLGELDYQYLNYNLDVLMSELGPPLRKIIEERARFISKRLSDMGYKMTESQSPNLNIICGNAGRVIMMCKYFRDPQIGNDVFATPLIGPAVINSESKERLRFTISAGLDSEKTSRLLTVAERYYPIYQALENRLDPSQYNPPEYILQYSKDELNGSVQLGEPQKEIIMQPQVNPPLSRPFQLALKKIVKACQIAQQQAAKKIASL